MSRYVLTADAQLDLQQIRDYVLNEGGFRAARYVVGALVTGFRSLARTPGQGHRRDDLTPRMELRFWSVFSALRRNLEKCPFGGELSVWPFLSIGEPETSMFGLASSVQESVIARRCQLQRKA